MLHRTEGGLSRLSCGSLWLSPISGQGEVVGDRAAADLERELTMLAQVRQHLRASEGEDFRIPTTTVDEVLDELNSVERSPWDPT